MKIEIWSDVMCPFCYIGKRKFEAALAQFDGKEQVEIEWKSFQLNPDMETDPGKSINTYLAEIKGWSVEQAKQMNDHVTGLAARVGLKYDFNKSIVANSFDAHRMVQFAKRNGKGDAAEEQLFKAYFTDGKNIADKNVLLEIGKTIGLDTDELNRILNSSDFSKEVLHDVSEAQALGIRGVPFFVFDRKYGVSGAQETAVFLDTLNKALEG